MKNVKEYNLNREKKILEDENIFILSYENLKEQYIIIFETSDKANIKASLIKRYPEVLKSIYHHLEFKGNFYRIYHLLKNNLTIEPKCKYCGKDTYYQHALGFRDHCGQCAIRLSEQVRSKSNFSLTVPLEQISNSKLKEKLLLALMPLNSRSYYQSLTKINKMLIAQIFKRTEYLDSTHKFNERIYHIQNNYTSKIICTYCNKETLTFLDINRGYSDTCSSKCGLNKCIPKKKKTCLEKYGVENIFMTQQCKDGRKKFDLKNPEHRHNLMYRDGIHIMQIAECFEKSSKIRWKKYIYPSGNIVNIQGYEDKAIDNLLLIYSEEEIIIKRKEMPSFYYFSEDNKRHRYYPDLWIPKDNLIIEVKSNWTYDREVKRNLLKRQSVLDAGYKFEFMIYIMKEYYNSEFIHPFVLSKL